MPAPQPPILLYFPSARLPAIITRLTTYLLHHQYDFLQTCHDASHMDFDILMQRDHPPVRLILRAGDGPATSLESLASQQPPFPKPVRLLLQHLLRPPPSAAQSTQP
jgi:hypothetical protein